MVASTCCALQTEPEQPTDVVLQISGTRQSTGCSHTSHQHSDMNWKASGIKCVRCTNCCTPMSGGSYETCMGLTN